MKIDKISLLPESYSNNVYLVGDEKCVVMLDASHNAKQILEKVAKRPVEAILITHGHSDHINVALELKKATGAPIYLHPDDRFLWGEQFSGSKPDKDLADGDELELAGAKIQVLHTPGHTPGSCSFYLESEATVFTGDTLFPGGPGATRWDYSDFEAIINSIKTKLFALPPETKVLPGHGDSTTIGAEQPNLGEWTKRGW